MWVAQHWRHGHPRRHLTSGSLGAMGFGLPAAIGAQIARPDATVVCVSGDGSIMMNLQEFATVRRNGLPIKLVLLDNQAVGMVRQWQDLFFAARFSEVDLSDNPDFVALARGFGIAARSIDRADEVDGALDELLAAPGPMLLHVAIPTEAGVRPLVPPGRSSAVMPDAPALAAAPTSPTSPERRHALLPA